MDKKRVKNIKEIIYILLIVVFFILVFLFMYRAHSNLELFKDYKNYFKSNSKITIEPWMTPETVVRHFNINETVLLNELNMTKKDLMFREPIDKICKKKKIDCLELVTKLNNLTK